MFPHQRLRIGLGGPAQGRKGAGVAHVAQGHADVPEKPAPLGPPDRAVAEAFAEARVVQREQFQQVRRGQVGAGADGVIGGGLGELVPGQTARQSSQP